MKRIAGILLLLACVLGPSTGCSYLESRAKDVMDCFKLSADWGLGASFRVQVGPLGAGLGAWQGKSAGILGSRGFQVWQEEHYEVPFPLSAPVCAAMLGVMTVSLGRFPEPLDPAYWDDNWVLLLCSGVEFMDLRPPPGDWRGLSLREFRYSAAFWTLPMTSEILDYSPARHFWVEATARVFAGLNVGFNVAEFADFLLGWFGFDILSDDGLDRDAARRVPTTDFRGRMIEGVTPRPPR